MLRFTDNLIIQTTLDCNYNCKFCMQGDQKDRVDLFNHRKMSFEDIKQIIDATLYERCVLGSVENFVDFHLHGGELFLLDFALIKRVVNYILERKQYFPNITCCVQSNGSLLTEEICEFFSRKYIPIGVSFDGFHEQKMHNCSEDPVKKIERLYALHKNSGVTLGFLSLITQDNVKTLYDDTKRLGEIFNKNRGDHAKLIVGSNILCGFNEDSYSKVPSYEDIWKYYYKKILIDMKLHKNEFEDSSLDIMIEYALNEILFKSGIDCKTGCFDKLCGFYSNMISVDPKFDLSPCDKWMVKGEHFNLKPSQPISQSDFLGMQHVNKVIKYYKEFHKLNRKYDCFHCFAKGICPGQCQAHQISTKGYIDQNTKACEMYKTIYSYINKNWVDIASNKYWKIKGKAEDITSRALVDIEDYKKKLVLYNGAFRVEER